MGLLTIDTNKCQKDGACVRECPFAIIAFREDTGYPEIVPGGESGCIACGHCVAVCPYGALSHEEVRIQDCPDIQQRLTINEEQAVQFLRSRRSTRLYDERPVEEEKIQRLIEVARYAPTASNMQEVEWLVLREKSKIRGLAAATIDWLRKRLGDDPNMAILYPRFPLIVKLWDDGRDSILRNAPVLVIATAPKEAANGMVDVTLALCSVDLLAPAMGLGTCWAGLLQGALLASSSLRDLAGIPADHGHYYPLMLGYPKVERYYRLPERRPPKITFR